jgi:hypothetical protein
LALLETVRVIGRELAPFFPGASEQLRRTLSAPADAEELWNTLPEGAPLPASLLLFPRRDPEHEPHILKT